MIRRRLKKQRRTIVEMNKKKVMKRRRRKKVNNKKKPTKMRKRLTKTAMTRTVINNLVKKMKIKYKQMIIVRSDSQRHLLRERRKRPIFLRKKIKKIKLSR